MDALLTGSNGRIYHLRPHELWWVARFLPKVTASQSPRTLLKRGGYPATVLRISGMANAFFVGPLSFGLVIATVIVSRHHPVTATPYLVDALIYTIVAGPFYFLLYRRRFQSAREARAFRAAASEQPSE